MKSKKSQFCGELAEPSKPKRRSRKSKPLLSALCFLFLALSSLLSTLCFLLLALSSFCWADQVAIRPRACFPCEFIGRTGCSVDDDCVDEVSPDEDTSFVSSNSNSADNEGFYCDSVNFSTIDSIKIKARSRKTGLFGTSNAWAIGALLDRWRDSFLYQCQK
jgi:hypothetical protein